MASIKNGISFKDNKPNNNSGGNSSISSADEMSQVDENIECEIDTRMF